MECTWKQSNKKKLLPSLKKHYLQISSLNLDDSCPWVHHVGEESIDGRKNKYFKTQAIFKIRVSLFQMFNCSAICYFVAKCIWSMHCTALTILSFRHYRILQLCKDIKQILHNSDCDWKTVSTAGLQPSHISIYNSLYISVS